MQRPLLFALILLLALLLGGAWYWNRSTEAPDAPTAPPAPTANETGGASLQTGTAPIQAAEATAPERAEAAAQPAAIADGLALLRVHAKWPDGAAAPGIRIRLRGWSTATNGLDYEFVTTDADGVATFRDVAPGKFRASSHRGDRETFDVEPGVNDVDLVLDGGVTVTGRVVDEDERPVGRASVWLQTRDPKTTGGCVVATTADDGSFRLERTPTHVSLGAFAAGYLRSALLDLDDVETDSDPVHVTLIVRSGGGTLTGLVTDTGDRPLAGAKVALGKEDGRLDMQGDRVIERWSIPNTVTDDDGRFTLVSLKPGDALLTARAEGHGFVRVDVTVAAEEPADVHVRMAASGAVHGVVRDDAGEPVAGANVRSYDVEPSTRYLSLGQIDFDEAFGFVHGQSDGEGRFRVEDVTAGEAWLFVQPGGRRTRSAVLHTEATLEVPSGGAVEWNPVLSKGRTIRGVLRYRDGHAMGNCFVMLNDERSDTEHVINNERDGTFEFLNLADTSYSLRVQYPFDSPTDAAPLERAGLRPDGAPLELTAPFDKPVKLAKGTVIGRVDDVGLRITNPKNARVALMSEERWFRDNGTLEDGAFRFDDVTPCKFRLALMQGDATLATSDVFELLPGAQLDTGVLRTVPGGGVRVRVARGVGCEALAPKLYFRRDGAARSTTVALGTADELDVPNLTPGDYAVTGYSKGMVSIDAKVTVTAGARAPLSLTMTRGALVRVEAFLPEGSTPTGYSYTVRDASGKKVHGYESKWYQQPTRPFTFVRTMAPGRYTIALSVQLATGELAADSAFTVSADFEDATVRLDPKPR